MIRQSVLIVLTAVPEPVAVLCVLYSEKVSDISHHYVMCISVSCNPA